MESYRDESGLFGIANHRQAAHLAYLGLLALQHRGDRAAGIVSTDGSRLEARHGRGLVPEVFAGMALQDLPGNAAIGQASGVRTGDCPGMPLLARFRGGQVALAMSGRLTNGPRLRESLKEGGALFTTTSDAEIVLHLVAQSAQRTFVNRLVDALWKVEGSFCLLVLTEDRFVAVRDPHGFRPFVLGNLGGATIVSTEDGPIRFLSGEVRRELDRGEMLIVDSRGTSAVRPFQDKPRATCIQEFSRIASADAHVFGQAAYPIRVALGERLAKEHPCKEADVVVALPDAARPAALGYARVLGRPLAEGLVRSAFAEGQAVEPAREVPDFGARLRWTPVPAVLDEKRVVLVAASLGTGAEVRKAVRLLRGAGAREVHLRVAAPPARASCPYGLSSPMDEELAWSRHGGTEEVGASIGVDSVGFLSLEGMHQIAGTRADGSHLHCDACYSTAYPIPPVERDDQIPLFDRAPGVRT